MSVADDLSDLFDSLGAGNTAASGLADTFDGLNNSARTTADALGKVAGPIRDAKGRFVAAGKAAGDAAKGIEDAARAVEAVKPAASSASGAVNNLASSVIAGLAPAWKQAKKAGGEALEHLRGKAVDLSQGMVPATGATGALAGALEAMGPKGKLAAVVLSVLAAVVTGLASQLWELTKTAIAVAQEKTALAETFAAIYDGAKSGLEVVDDLSEVAAKLPFDEDQVLGWGKAMMAAGKAGDELDQSLQAIAASAAIMRDNGAAALAFSKRLQTAADVGEKIKLDKRMQRMLQETGVRAVELAKALGIPADKLSAMAIDAGKLGDAFEKGLIAKGGGALEAMSREWTSIMGRLKTSWGDLFEDQASVAPLMAAVRDFFSEFDAGGKLQSGAKSLLTSFFEVVLGWATRATRAIHIAFLEVQIAALRAYIWAAPLVRLFRDIYTNALVLRGLKVILYALVTPLVIILGAVGVVIAAFLALAAAAGVVAGLATGAFAAAAGFIAGLVDGIMAGADEVVDAVKHVASRALDAFTGFFQIKSPSRVMQRQGRQLPAGTAKGIEEGEGEVQRAMDDSAPRPGRARGRGATGGRGKLADTINITFAGRMSEFDEFTEKIEQWLERQAAGGPEPET